MPTTSANAATSKYAWSLIARTAPPERGAAERVADYREIVPNTTRPPSASRPVAASSAPTPSAPKACPLANRIPEWLALAAQGQFLEAAAISRSTSNMPEICSRVCPQERLCEGACILNCKSDPVAIGAVERFINEYAFARDAVDATPATPNGLRAAVIGSGPAGIACADELAKVGYRVTVFESLHLPGGLLVNGIPAFKLEKSIVARRIDLLVRRGVEFELGVAVGRDVSLAELRRTARRRFPRPRRPEGQNRRRPR